MQASNTLMITKERSTTGRPLMVGGPQIDYFYPGLTYEIDMHAGDLQWRGATSAPFPGYMLIGRGEDFANTLTSASGGHHRPVRRDALRRQRHEVPVQGRVPRDGQLRRRHARRSAGHVPDHRARPGRRLRNQERNQGRDLAEALELRQGHARPALLPSPLQRARSTARRASSRPPRRRRRRSTRSTSTTSTSPSSPAGGCRCGIPTSTRVCRPRAPASTSGRASSPTQIIPQGIDPEDGTIVNWNQTVARGFGAADNEWGRNGSVARNDLLTKNLARLANEAGRVVAAPG